MLTRVKPLFLLVTLISCQSRPQIVSSGLLSGTTNAAGDYIQEHPVCSPSRRAIEVEGAKKSIAI